MDTSRIALFFALISTGYALYYGVHFALLTWSWGERAEWLEARKDAKTRIVRFSKWVLFKWWHPDGEFWIFPVNFGEHSRVVITGITARSLYWSINFTSCDGLGMTGYVGRSVSFWPSENERFKISMGKCSSDGSDYIVPVSQKRGVIYLRIYMRDADDRTPLPTVTCIS